MQKILGAVMLVLLVASMGFLASILFSAPTPSLPGPGQMSYVVKRGD